MRDLPRGAGPARPAAASASRSRSSADPRVERSGPRRRSGARARRDRRAPARFRLGRRRARRRACRDRAGPGEPGPRASASPPSRRWARSRRSEASPRPSGRAGRRPAPPSRGGPRSRPAWRRARALGTAPRRRALRALPDRPVGEQLGRRNETGRARRGAGFCWRRFGLSEGRGLERHQDGERREDAVHEVLLDLYGWNPPPVGGVRSGVEGPSSSSRHRSSPGSRGGRGSLRSGRNRMPTGGSATATVEPPTSATIAAGSRSGRTDTAASALWVGGRSSPSRPSPEPAGSSRACPPRRRPSSGKRPSRTPRTPPRGPAGAGRTATAGARSLARGLMDGIRERAGLGGKCASAHGHGETSMWFVSPPEGSMPKKS